MGYSVVSTARRNFHIAPENKGSPDPCVHGISPVMKLTTSEMLNAVYQWIVCLFITALVLSQVFGAVWNSITTSRIVEYGRDPLGGPYQVVGTNDVPYADRVITCIGNGKFYEPRLVSSLLAAEGTDAILEDSTGAAKHGYRLVQRRNGSISDELDSSVRTSYMEICSLISKTLDSILGSCSALGYMNFTVDSLRVVESADSKRLFRLPNSLPVLIMPFWDNTELARHAVPTWSGDACVFRLEDAFSGKAAANASRASFRGVNRTIRHERTVNWLTKSGGVWKNGWYEDLDGGRWFSDVVSSNPGAPYYMGYRLFDMWTGSEKNCSVQEDCLASPTVSRWGTKFSSSSYTRNIDSITLLNGSSFGIFHFKALQIQTAHITYDWETLVSNASVVVVIVRWIMILVALHIGAVRGSLPYYGGGIGCLAGSSSFSFLIISTLPQLKMMLAAFWTVGCRFEGQQAALSNAWFTVYPAIVQLMILYFSLLNVLAKVTRRRMSDVLFGPTVFFFCFVHYYAGTLAASGWLKGIDGRVATVVFSDEVKKLHLHDYFISDLAWRMNGKVNILFSTKLVVLGINLLPLLLARPFKVHKRDAKLHLGGIEQALALKANRVGGLGRSPVYMGISTDNGRKVLIAPSESLVFLNSYELLHLGYVVFGDKYVVACDEWDLLTAMAPLRNYCYLWNHRVCIWTLKELKTGETNARPRLRALSSVQPEMWRLDDKRLVRIAWWQVSSCAIQC